MDAAHTYFNKTVLFLATALLMVVPGLAQPSFVLNGSAANRHGCDVREPGRHSSPSPARWRRAISFTATVAYASGDQPWLTAWPAQSSQVSGTTPTTLYLPVVNYSGCHWSQHPAVITLHVD